MGEKAKLGVQLGFGKRFDRIGAGPDTLSGDMMIPISITGMYGKEPHHLELGLGTTLKFQNGFSNGKYIYPTIEGKILFMGTLQAGYRYHPPLDGIVIRLNYTGIFQYLNGHPAAGPQVNHWFGASIGIALRNANVK